MKCVVTGGAGFIGSNLVDELVNQGNEVVVIDNLSTGDINNLNQSMDKIRFVEGDILNLDLLQKEFKDADYVFHLAALPSVQRSVEDPDASLQNNAVGTHNVLIAAKDNKVKRVIYSSSSSAYGNTKELPKVESMAPAPLSPYAVAKLAGEYYCRAFTNVFGLDTISLRYFNVFGPRQKPDSQYAAAIPKFVNLLLEDKAPTIFGDGMQSRDFTFIKNVVNANVLASKAKNTDGEVINIACGDRINLNELVKIINKIIGKKIEPRYGPERKGDVKHSLADVSKANKLIGYSPEISFEDGLKITIEWLKNES